MPLYFAKTQNQNAFWLSVQKSETHYKIEKSLNINSLLPFGQNIQFCLAFEFWRENVMYSYTFSSTAGLKLCAIFFF